MKKRYGLSLLIVTMLCACSSSPNSLKKSPYNLLRYLDKSGEIELNLTENSGPLIDLYYPDLSNEEILSNTEYMVYAEISDVNYYNDKQLYSIVELNVIKSFGSEPVPQTLYLVSDQCILPAREAIADPQEYAQTLEEYEKDLENTWLPDEDEYYVQIIPGERFYGIGDKYIFLLKESEFKSSATDEPLMSSVLGPYSEFMEVGDNQFVGVQNVHSDLQTLTLDSEQKTDFSLSDQAIIFNKENFERLKEGGDFPVPIYTKSVHKKENS